MNKEKQNKFEKSEAYNAYNKKREQELKVKNETFKSQVLARELREKKEAKELFYKNVNSIRKNVQFFFWTASVSIVIYFFIILITNASKI